MPAAIDALTTASRARNDLRHLICWGQINEVSDGTRTRQVAGTVAGGLPVGVVSRRRGGCCTSAQGTRRSAFDWTGGYFGGHFGFATGYSTWTATQANGTAPNVSGSLDLYNPYNLATGTGSYFAGLQTGYNHMIGSRLLVGAEADIAFPSRPVGLTGTQTFNSPAVGQASYQIRSPISARCAGASATCSTAAG